MQSPTTIEYRPAYDNPDSDRTRSEAARTFSDCLDGRTVTSVKSLIYAITRAPHLHEEREDCLQQALFHFWQSLQKRPGDRFNSLLRRCQFFVRDSLKRGKSVDSPKRRWQGCSIDSGDSDLELHEAVFVSTINPLELAITNDDLRAVMSRLNKFEHVVLNLFLEGNGTREVARRLHMSPSGIGKSHERIRIAARKIGLCPRPDRSRKKKNYLFGVHSAFKIP